MMQFETGAVRDDQDGKEDYVETINWSGIRRYAQYMTEKASKYGPGNWRKGIDLDSYERSLARHFQKYFANKYENAGLEPNEDHLSAMMFNILGIMDRERQYVDEGLGYVKEDTQP